MKPLELSQDTIAVKMQEFRRSDTYAIIVGLWKREREALLQKGKKLGKAELWSELEGYDRASTIVEVWADKPTRESLQKQLGDPALSE